MAAAAGALRLLLAGPGLRRRRLKSFPLSAGVPKLGFHSKPSHKYVPRRAVLYVPADDERKIKKIPSLNVDCAVLDCEDGVALNRKGEARLTVVKTLKEFAFGQTEKCVRINSVSSGLAEQDLEVLLSSSILPSSLMLPKVENAEEIRWLTSLEKSYRRDYDDDDDAQKNVGKAEFFIVKSCDLFWPNCKVTANCSKAF